MNNTSILLLDPTFDPASVGTCTLLIKVGRDAFSYAIIENGSYHVRAVFDQQECEDPEATLTERLKTDPYLTLPYKEVKIAVNTINAISIPNDLYREEDLAVHAQYFSKKPHQNVHSHLQDYFGFTTVFSLPLSLATTLENHFPQSDKYHEFAGILSIGEQIGGSGLILDFSVGIMNVLYLQDAKIHFQHSYDIANSEELQYYILLIIDQLDINSTGTRLLLSGIVHENDEKHNCLRKYFEDIDYLIIGDQLNKEILDDMPLHYYTSLLALNQCE